MTLDATCPPLVKSACKHSSLEHTQVTFMVKLESVMASLTKHSAAESLLATSQSRHSVNLFMVSRTRIGLPILGALPRMHMAPPSSTFNLLSAGTWPKKESQKESRECFLSRIGQQGRCKAQ